MLRTAKLTGLNVLRAAGFFRIVANSDWRRQRLLILCYHGTSLEDEHLWRPLLYIHPEKLERRLQLLKKGGYSVVPLGEGLGRLRSGTLPHRSVAITFDDGTYDFYRQAYPLLKAYDFPATVYQTTYYSSLQLPVFNLVCNYMLWKRRGELIPAGESIGLSGTLDTRTEHSRFLIVRQLIEQSQSKTGMQKDEIASRLAAALKIDYQLLKTKRILHLMNGEELQDIARHGIDLQLHTHRHRTPDNENLFRREIEDNRSALQNLTRTKPVHFCYPSGVYREAFLPWLRKEEVASATTCDTGLAERGSESLLLPRYIDHQKRTHVEFESWVTGVGHLLAMRRKAVQEALPNYGDGLSSPS
jgi:peptidoglycan/xylan/chitin deacetylase (PgdA/CDA1 family)